jgi:hypothetical protein
MNNSHPDWTLFYSLKAGLMSRTGVPLIASRYLTLIVRPLFSKSSTVQRPIVFGRSFSRCP